MSIVLFALCGFITYTFTCRKRLSSSVGSRGRLATLARNGIFSVFEGAVVVIAVEEALPSFQTAL
jgi:hypothetical protein